MSQTSDRPLTSIPTHITIDRMPGENAEHHRSRQRTTRYQGIQLEEHAQLPTAGHTWPTGQLTEGWTLFGDIVESLLRFLYWIFAVILRIFARLLMFCAQWLGIGARSISHGRMKERASLVIGWILLVAILLSTLSGIAITKGWTQSLLRIAHSFSAGNNHTSTRTPPPMQLPPNTCTTTGINCAPATIYLDGAPSIGADRILTVLQAYQSPAATAAFAQELYALGVKYGVNPAYALGFFAEESHCGTQGVATQTLSLGNIRFTQSNSPIGYGNIQGFRAYSSWSDGAEDWFWTIRTYYINQNIRSISDTTPMYAPASDHNDPVTYARDVYQFVQTWSKP